MSDQIDQALGALSPDELQVLNNDPQMQADFKAKYAAPVPNPNATEAIREGVTQGAQGALPSPSFAQPLAPTSPNPVIGGAQAALQTLRDPTRIQATEQQALTKMVGEPIENAGKAVGFPETAKPVAFAAKTVLDPLTWIAMGEKILPDAVKEGIPGLLRKAASIPEKATELEGYNQPIPTQAEIETGVKNVQDMVGKVWKEHGDLLNKANAEAGLPASKAEIAESNRKFGNPFGLDLNKPLAQPKNLTQMAPEMEEGIAGPVHPDGTQVFLKGTMGGGISPNTGQPLPKTNIWGVRNSDPNVLKAQFGDVSPGSVPENVLKEKGYQLPGQTNLTNMPYKIGAHDTAEQLQTEIERFKANLPYIDKKDQVKAASYLQDQIATTPGMDLGGAVKGKTLGVLKSQRNDLAQVISGASDTLASAKSKMGDLYDIMDDVNKKLSAGPGKAESYLRTLFTSKSPAVKDDLKALAKLETLSGQPVLQTLFKKFAGEAYGQSLGQSVHTIFQAPYAALTSPRGVIGPALRYGPGVAKGLKFGAIGGVESNMSNLQSVGDRLKNADNQ
jgi:hypothetical protein